MPLWTILASSMTELFLAKSQIWLQSAFPDKKINLILMLTKEKIFRLAIQIYHNIAVTASTLVTPARQ